MDLWAFQTANLENNAARQAQMLLTAEYTGKHSSTSMTQVMATMAQACNQDSTHESSLSRGMGNSTTPWTAEEDDILLKAQARGMNWEQIHQVYLPYRSTHACRKRYARLRWLSKNQPTVRETSLSIHGLYTHASESLTQLAGSLDCARCEEAGSKIELREMAAQLHMWAKGLDFLHLEKSVDRDTHLQLLVVRRLSNIADVVQSFLGCKNAGPTLS